MIPVFVHKDLKKKRNFIPKKTWYPFSNKIIHFILLSTENTTLEIRFDLMNETEIQTGGLVEVFDGVETWGYICSYGWIIDDGNIACIHMGYPGAMAAYSIDVSYHRKTHYSLTNIICSAYRGFSSIDECLFVQFKEENCLCEPQRVAGVVCAIGKDIIRITYLHSYTVMSFSSLLSHYIIRCPLKEFYVICSSSCTLEHIIVLNKYCTYNKPIPRISHVKTLQNLC